MDNQNNVCNEIILDFFIECTKCNGTGLYIGMAERNGAAVVCHHCNGTGKEHIHQKYTKFTSKKKHRDAVRVFKTSAGFIISANDVVASCGEAVNFSKCGCSYEEWENGVEPKPIRKLHCPIMHYGQDSYLYKILCEKKGLLAGMDFRSCAKKNKEECWEKFDNFKLDTAQEAKK